MIRNLGALTVVLLLVTAPGLAQQTAASTGLRTKVLDLIFRVEDLANNVQGMSGSVQAMSSNVRDMSGNVRDMSAKVRTMVGKSKDLAVKVSRTEVRIDLASDVLFDFDSADIQPKARQTLERVAQFIGNSAKGLVRILGYTDGKGSTQYNQGLSERRAQSVKIWFVEKDGLTRVDFATQGFGMRDPVAPNTKADGSDFPEGRRKNRRVEIVIHK
jgi:outer membrane protein OmpA-like peptidoglycan-associated protein